MDENKKLQQKIDEWQDKVIKPTMSKMGLKKPPTKFYTPVDLGEFDFEEQVGLPGQYPFTAGNDAMPRWQAFAKVLARSEVVHEWGDSGVGKYAGFGTAEDYRDYLLRMHSLGRKGGPNIAMDLPTQCGYDSDNPRSEGEVGKVGVAIDSLKDFEIIYEPYTGDLDLDKIASNFTINAPAVVIISMYAKLAEKRGISLNKLRGTPQNDILKEYVGRGTYIYPPKQALRLFRDSLVFCNENIPKNEHYEHRRLSHAGSRRIS